MKRELERIEIPGEHEARERTWQLVSVAFGERTPAARRPARRLAPALAVVVLGAIVAAAFSSPGRAVFHAIRKTVGVEKARPALFSLPTGGRLLVTSTAGVWVVEADGSKRLLGRYDEASWSPHGRLRRRDTAKCPVRADPVRGGAVVARPTRCAFPTLDGNGHGHTDRLPDDQPAPRRRRRRQRRRRRRRHRRWPLRCSPSRAGLATRHEARARIRQHERPRICGSTSTPGRTSGPSGPFAPHPSPGHADSSGRVTVRGCCSSPPTRSRSSAPAAAAPLDIRSERVVAAAFRPGTHDVAVVRRPGEVSQVLLGAKILFSTAGELRGLTWSPDGRWLLVGLPEADQWVFVRADGRQDRRRLERIRTIPNPRLPPRGRLVLHPVGATTLVALVVSASCSGQATPFPKPGCGPRPVQAS